MPPYSKLRMGKKTNYKLTQIEDELSKINGVENVSYLCNMTLGPIYKVEYAPTNIKMAQSETRDFIDQVEGVVYMDMIGETRKFNATNADYILLNN